MGREDHVAAHLALFDRVVPALRPDVHAERQVREQCLEQLVPRASFAAATASSTSSSSSSEATAARREMMRALALLSFYLDAVDVRIGAGGGAVPPSHDLTVRGARLTVKVYFAKEPPSMRGRKIVASSSTAAKGAVTTLACNTLELQFCSQDTVWRLRHAAAVQYAHPSTGGVGLMLGGLATAPFSGGGSQATATRTRCACGTGRCG